MTPLEYLADKFPPLASYCPINSTFSPQQVVFLLDPSREVMYGGAVGGGKSAALLAAALRYVHMPKYSALILRRTYSELEKSGGLIPLADSWLIGTDAKRADGGKKWRFPSGARIEFGHVQHEHNKVHYQGAAYTMVAFDELTHFPESVYDYIGFSRQRRDVSIVAPIQTLSTANPGGVGHLWVKERFIDNRRPQCLFVPAKVKDNPAWREGEYEQSLAYLNPELRRQLLEGDWNAFEHQAFPDFGKDHLVASFSLRAAMHRVECADYGLGGTAWHLLVKDYDGNFVFADSVYDNDKIPKDIAKLVHVKRRKLWGAANRVEMDPSIWKRTGAQNAWGQPATLATEFQQVGIDLSKANNDPRLGYARMRRLMETDPNHKFPAWHPRKGQLGAPRLFVNATGCPDLAEQLQAAPLQPIEKADGGEKIDPEWEGDHGHAVAAARYGIASWAAGHTNPEPEKQLDGEAWLRHEALRKHDETIAARVGGEARFINV